MKHAVVRAKKARKILPPVQVGTTKKARKISKPEAVKLVKNAKAKIGKKRNVSVSQSKKINKKTVKPAAAVVTKSKPQTAKSAPVVFKKTGSKKAVPVVISKKPKTKKSAPVVAAKSKRVNLKAAKFAPAVSPKTKTVKPKITKSKILKAAPVVSKTKTAKQKVKPLKPIAPKKKQGAAKAFQKPKAKINKAETLVKTKPINKKNKAIIVAPKNKLRKEKIAPVKAIAKISRKVKKALVLPAAKLKPENKKNKAIVSTPKNKLKKGETAPVAAVQKIGRAAKKAEASQVVMSRPKVLKMKPAIVSGKRKILEKKAQALSSKLAKKSKKEEIKQIAAARQLAKLIETKIEAAPTKPKKTKPIGAAVFRGKKDRYDFQVYPLDAQFENVSAIYVISKRKTDRHKRGHHALVCIGQTDSVVNELKKHTRGKCVKKHQANVISILPEANEKRRLKIEEDLKAAHSIACNIG